MATVTGFTAARMQEIEDNSLDLATVVNGRLILRRKNGTTFDAGSVAGIQGVPGASGEVSTATLNAHLATLRAEDSAAGKGVVGHVALTSGQSIVGTDGQWQNVTGASLTITPIPNRYYQFTAQVVFNKSASAPTFFAIVAENPAMFLQGSLPESPSAYTVGKGISINKIIKAPVGWNVPMTFRIQNMSIWGVTTHILNGQGLSGTSLTITDLGTGP